jgi:hypothetical protein
MCFCTDNARVGTKARVVQLDRAVALKLHYPQTSVHEFLRETSFSGQGSLYSKACIHSEKIESRDTAPAVASLTKNQPSRAMPARGTDLASPFKPRVSLLRQGCLNYDVVLSSGSCAHHVD